MKHNRLSLTGWETFWYILGNILTLGLPYFSKIVRKKALIDVWNAEYIARLNDSRPEARS